jgi:hypothetical protein
MQIDSHIDFVIFSMDTKKCTEDVVQCESGWKYDSDMVGI